VGCAPIVEAFAEGAKESRPFPDARTVAFGITVPKALGDFLVLESLYATGGTAVAVTDEDLLDAQRKVAELEGAFICPEGAACFAAVDRLRESGWLAGGEEVVVLNTGAGIKYPETIEIGAPLLAKTDSIPAVAAVW
jgi:threonine synthase